MTRLTGLSLPSRIRGWLVALEMGATPSLRPTAKDGETPIYDRVVAECYGPMPETEKVGAER